MSQQFHFVSIGTVKKNDNVTQLVIKEQYQNALLRVDEFSHIIVLWWISGRDTKEDRSQLIVRPFVNGSREQSPETGVFACRSPLRPNPIGLTIVKILKVERNVIFIDKIDAFDGTPIVDLKPYIPKSDCVLKTKLPSFMESISQPREE